MEVADVSVVIPYFEAADCIERCLRSIAHQTVRVREVIVVDDGSATAFSLTRALRSTARSNTTVLCLERNQGAAAARNAGVARAKGKYVAFLDADDAWMPQKIEVQFRLMEQGDWVMSAHGYASTNPGATPERTPKVRPVRRFDFIVGNPFFTPTVMVLRKSFKPFDESFRRADDYKAWLENLELGRTFLIKSTLAYGFKPTIGHSGLTGSVLLMHRSFVRVLTSLVAERKVSLRFYFATAVVEYIKLPARIIRVGLGRIIRLT